MHLVPVWSDVRQKRAASMGVDTRPALPGTASAAQARVMHPGLTHSLTDQEEAGLIGRSEVQMNDGAQARIEADHAPLAAPSWVQTFMALAGVALLIGPTLGMLWPR